MSDVSGGVKDVLEGQRDVLGGVEDVLEGLRDVLDGLEDVIDCLGNVLAPPRQSSILIILIRKQAPPKIGNHLCLCPCGDSSVVGGDANNGRKKDKK